MFRLERTAALPYSSCVNWWLGGSLLVLAGILLRRLLRLNAPSKQGLPGLLPLSPERESIYLPVAQEIGTQCTILGIALNDAIDERDSGHHEIAWRLVGLCAGEWDRVAEILSGLHATLGKHIGDARVAVPVRSMAAHRFKSRTMVDYFRMHELLDQLVFRSKMRFHLQVWVLRRAAETLTAEFYRTYLYADRNGDRSPELWTRLDLLYHDFDLLTKESLLAFRAFLACLPDSALPALAGHLPAVVRQRERPAALRTDD